MKVCLFLIFIYSTISLACEDINLYKTNKSFAAIPISDQDSTGTCYAYTATTLLDSERFENGVSKSKRTHPLFAAYVYHREKGLKSSVLSSGFVHSSIRALAKSKLCLEFEGEKQIERYKGDNFLSDSDFMGLLEKNYGYFDKSQAKKREKNNIEEKDFLGCNIRFKTIEQQIYNTILEDFQLIPRKVVPSLVMEKILKQCISNSKFSPLINVDNLKDNECETCSDQSMQEYIEKQIKRNKPVAISYCAEALYDKNSKEIKENDFFSYSDNKRVDRRTSKCSSHASVVAGTRKNKGKCQMLLRNSWGDWKSNTWKDCLCETTKGNYEPCKRGDTKLNSVGCWIDSDALVRNTYRTTHF